MKIKIKKKKTRNSFEAGLDLQLKRSGLKFKYEAEKIPYVISGHYIPDFIIETPTGRLYVEAKGYFRPEAKRKMVAVKKQNPEKDFRIVFCLSSKKQMLRYTKWAQKHGFKFSFGSIPPEWLEGL